MSKIEEIENKINFLKELMLVMHEDNFKEVKHSSLKKIKEIQEELKKIKLWD